MTCGWGGDHSNGKRGIRLVHGHTKGTLITYFSGMKIDPTYAFLHAFFLICLSCPFQTSLCDQKHTLFFPILHFYFFCTPEQCMRVHCLVLKNNPNYVNFWASLIPPLTFEWPPGLWSKKSSKKPKYISLGYVQKKFPMTKKTPSILHVTFTFSLKQGQTRTSSGPIRCP